MKLDALDSRIREVFEDLTVILVFWVNAAEGEQRGSLKTEGARGLGIEA